MEFTKAERRVLSQTERQTERTIRIAFWTGVVFVSVGTAMVPYGYFKLRSMRNIWREVHEHIQNVNAQSEVEKDLKKTALTATEFVAETWYEYQIEKLARIVISFWFVGLWLIVFSKREKVYRGLIKKLQGP